MHRSKQGDGGDRCECMQYHFLVTVQWKQVKVEASDGKEKNKE